MTNTPGHSAAPSPLPYGTPDEPRLAVRGEASLEFDPEIARITVTVGARGKDRQDALTSLTRRNGAALELIKEYGEAVEKLATGSFSVSPEPAEKGKRERVRTYSGRVQTTATVGDFTVLGEMTTRLADLDLTRVEGPWWALRPDSPVYGEARRRAVREAVARAREYAAAVGAELVALVELADPGAEHGPSGAAPPPPPLSAGYRAATAEGPGALDLEPQPQRVQAQVNARFLMSRPAL